MMYPTFSSFSHFSLLSSSSFCFFLFYFNLFHIFVYFFVLFFPLFFPLSLSFFLCGVDLLYRFLFFIFIVYAFPSSTPTTIYSVSIISSLNSLSPPSLVSHSSLFLMQGTVLYGTLWAIPETRKIAKSVLSSESSLNPLR